jgi:hypothetical protein
MDLKVAQPIRAALVRNLIPSRLPWHDRSVRGVVILAFSVGTFLQSHPARGQDTSAPPDDAKRIFGIIPNYRTSPTLADYQPLSPAEKFRMATDDATDRGTFILAALFAAQGQFAESNPSFGHGWSAYGRYYAASLTDFVVGDFMTEAIYPALFRQDPRYFRRETGSGASRLGYAMGQLIITHGDGGTTQFNASEVLGNGTAVAIANAYYRDGRTWSANLTKLAIQLGVDAAANVIKEFAPDITRAVSRKTIER